MTVNEIIICRAPSSSFWQLGPVPPPHGSLVLIGWPEQSVVEDDDANNKCTAALLRAMTSIARLSFPCSEFAMAPARDSRTPTESDHVATVRRTSNPLVRLFSYLTGRPSSMTLMSTRDSTVARQIFEDGAYPWWLQGQFVLLFGSCR